MSTTAAASDNTTNPLVQIQEHEQAEARRVEERKRQILVEEEAAIKKSAEEVQAKEAEHKEKANGELKAFAEKEPVEILKKGREEATQNVTSAKKQFEGKKDEVVKSLVSEFTKTFSS